MKGCKGLQIFFGLICLIVTIAIGSLMVLLFLPYIGGDLTNGPLYPLYDGVRQVAQTVGLAGLEWAVICVVFALPTLLLVLATNLLLYGKRAGSIKAGSTLALFAVLIFAGATIWFRAALLGDYQQIGLYALAGLAGLFLLLAIITGAAANKAKKKLANAQANVANVAVVEQPQDNNVVETPAEEPQDVAVETPAESPAEQPVDSQDILYMAQDYSSVSEVADDTYEQNQVLSKKVLDKLKIARDLYEKGAITKDEYLAIVNKYLVQE